MTRRSHPFYLLSKNGGAPSSRATFLSEPEATRWAKTKLDEGAQEVELVQNPGMSETKHTMDRGHRFWKVVRRKDSK